MPRPDRRQMELPFQGHSATSQAAAEAAATRAPLGRERVLSLLQSVLPEGLTDEELQHALHMNPSTERPRRIELVRMRLVKDSGRTRQTRARVRAVVWVAAGKASATANSKRKRPA